MLSQLIHFSIFGNQDSFKIDPETNLVKILLVSGIMILGKEEQVQSVYHNKMQMKPETYNSPRRLMDLHLAGKPNGDSFLLLQLTFLNHIYIYIYYIAILKSRSLENPNLIWLFLLICTNYVILMLFL